MMKAGLYLLKIDCSCNMPNVEVLELFYRNVPFLSNVVDVKKKKAKIMDVMPRIYTIAVFEKRMAY